VYTYIYTKIYLYIVVYAFEKSMKNMFDRLWHEELDAVFDRLDVTTKERRETGLC
jgi:hypothetical protein